MRLVNRERVNGTEITIGQRVYYSKGKEKICKTYSAEYRNFDGRQCYKSLKTKNKTQARRQAIELQQKLEQGIEITTPSKILITRLTDNYLEITKAKGAAPKTISKYATDLEKLKEFCDIKNIRFAHDFSENDLYLYRQFLADKEYAAKTIRGAIMLAKQVFKWAWRQGMLQNYRLEAASFPKAKANPQPCFTTPQVDSLIEIAEGEEKLAFALMGFAGLRIGEVEQRHNEDIIIKDGHFTMIHICRGGSNGTTKDKDDRFVPIHPKIAEFLKFHRKNNGILVPTINARKLLKRIKFLCKECGFENPTQYKLHSFRHHFASLCANHGVAHRKALAWLGHSSSEMLDLYYHLHDEDSQKTMMALAESHTSAHTEKHFEDSLRTVEESKIVKALQVPEIKELVELLSNSTERRGFEPRVRIVSVRQFSKLLPSATRSSLHNDCLRIRRE